MSDDRHGTSKGRLSHDCYSIFVTVTNKLFFTYITGISRVLVGNHYVNSEKSPRKL